MGKQTLEEKRTKTYLKLLKAWALGKEKKAIKLQHKLLEINLKSHK